MYGINRKRYLWVSISALLQGLLLGRYAYTYSGLFLALPVPLVVVVPFALWLGQEHWGRRLRRFRRIRRIRRHRRTRRCRRMRRISMHMHARARMEQHHMRPPSGSCARPRNPPPADDVTARRNDVRTRQK